MPLPRYEEGVNSHAWHSSDSVAGIPIKKRRFLYIQPTSPPETPLEQEHDKEEISTQQKPSSSTADVPKEVSGSAFSNRSSSPKKEKESLVERDANLVQDNVNGGLNLHNQSSISDIGQCTGGMHSPGNSELQLSLLEKNRVRTEVSKAEFIVNEKSKVSRIPANTELLLAAKEPLPIASVGQNNVSGSKEHEKLDPFKWNLGLSKSQDCSTNNEDELNNNCTKLANRSHWDLNTTMESWEDSLNNAATARGTCCMDLIGATSSQDIKPVIGTKQLAVDEQRDIHFCSGKTIFGLSEQRPKLPSTSVDQVCRSEDLLNLRLQSSLSPQSHLSQEPSNFSSELVDSKQAQARLTLSNVLVSPSKPVQCGIVKSEPVVESSRLGCGVKVVPPKLVVQGIIKPEPFQGCGEKSQQSSTKNMIEVKAVKSEPNQGCIPENLKSGKTPSSHREIRSCHSEGPVSGDVAGCSDVSTVDAVSPDLSLPFEFPIATGSSSCTDEVPTRVMNLVQEASNAVSCVTSVLVSHCASLSDKEPKFTDDSTNVPRTECLSKVDPEQSILNSKDVRPVDSHGNEEVAESDEEKVNISADEEFCYDTDYESDGNHATGNVVDTKDKLLHMEDDEYEDGEVREPSVHSEKEAGAYAEEDLEHVDCRISNVAPLSDDIIITTSEIDDTDSKIVETTNADSSEQSDNTLPNNPTKYDGALPQESLSLEVQIVRSEKNALDDVVPRKTQVISGEDNRKDGDAVLSSNVTHSTSEGTGTKDGRDDVINEHEDVDRTNSLGNSGSGLSKTEPCGSSEEAAKDVNGKGNRSRIITLPRASNASSSGGTKPIPFRALPSQSEGEKFTAVVLGSDKLHARGSRDERYMDHRFERKRTRDQPYGSTGSEFRFGRGRGDNRLRSRHYDWDSSHDFSAEQCPNGFRFSRNRNAASDKIEGGGFVVARGGSTITAGRGRGGRKPLYDELSNFRHPTSRRRSPGGREPMPRGVQMVRRPPRDITPERCISGDGPDLVGLRHEEKYMRGLTGDMRNTVFSRSQPQFERIDDSFVRADESFVPMQRRVPLHIPRDRSKSPPRSRTRSPGPWSSPRRRSSDGFVGHPELTHCRSPRVYRMERMRSPHQIPCFAEEIVVRRHVSPPYMSRICNDMREIGSSREHERPRSFIPNRSPSGRILPRNTRRFDMVDPRERTENNEFFVGEMPPGRFHELVGDEGVDGRRKCIDRRGPVRPFRPPYNGPDYDEEDDTRPFRFCPEGAEFRERGSLRERGGVDRRMKGRPENPPRRTRSIEEQEENYWQNAQGWHEADFDDVSHMKRRRF